MQIDTFTTHLSATYKQGQCRLIWTLGRPSFMLSLIPPFGNPIDIITVELFHVNSTCDTPESTLEKRSDLLERVHALWEPRQKRKHMEQPVVLTPSSVSCLLTK
jgi:hypothetical protein